MANEQTKEVFTPFIYHNPLDGEWHWGVVDEKGYPVIDGGRTFSSEELCKAHIIEIRDAINTGIEQGRIGPTPRMP